MTTGGEAVNAASTAGQTEDLAFSVDTHLLRELGALLVGRDSTAVVELLKNAYDADATHVVLHGEQLGEHGSITISDDGHGMTYRDFTDKFLRIAGRSKEGGDRRSPILGRRYTGAKGIGRLSAHKLGEALTLESVPNPDLPDRSRTDSGFTADINWRAIESSDLSIDQAKEISATPSKTNPTEASGTTLTIRHLYSEWSTRQLNLFLKEVRSTRPDPALTGVVPQRVFPGEPLLPEINVADSGASDNGFTLELSGEFADSESRWPTLLASLNWMLEIDARDPEQVTYRIAPSRRTLSANPSAAARVFHHNRSSDGPLFVARVFIRDKSAGARSSRELRDVLETFGKDAAGIRVFSEGFRVLPYGSSRNDWLSIDSDYSVRRTIDVDDSDLPKQAGDERVFLLPNTSYYGAVFLHDVDSHGLDMVVNREGFLPNAAFDEVVDIIRRGVHLSVRLRAAVGAEASAAAKREKATAARSQREELLATAETDEIREASTPARAQLQQWLSAGRNAAAALRSAAPGSDADTRQNVEMLVAAIEQVSEASDSAEEEQAQLRVLASLGTQMSAFVHEINGVLGQARVVRDLLDKLADDSPTLTKRLTTIRTAHAEMILSLERQALYLSDSLDAEARRRRSRQYLQERVATAFRLLHGAAAARKVALIDATTPRLRTPPMYAAEVNVILTNLVSNAVKAADGGSGKRRVRVSGKSVEDSCIVLVENTGVRVDLTDAERWFRPFETTTASVDAVLGQGLGLGLPLTRRIIEEYGGSIRFISPAADMATTVQVTLPNR
jgi:signal transduction histidine kinase